MNTITGVSQQPQIPPLKSKITMPKPSAPEWFHNDTFYKASKMTPCKLFPRDRSFTIDNSDIYELRNYKGCEIQQHFKFLNNFNNDILLKTKKITPKNNSVNEDTFPKTALERAKQDHIKVIYSQDSPTSERTIKKIVIYYKDRTARHFEKINGKFMQVINPDSDRFLTVLIDPGKGTYDTLYRGILKQGEKYLRR